MLYFANISAASFTDAFDAMPNTLPAGGLGNSDTGMASKKAFMGSTTTFGVATFDSAPVVGSVSMLSDRTLPDLSLKLSKPPRMACATSVPAGSVPTPSSTFDMVLQSAGGLPCCHTGVQGRWWVARLKAGRDTGANNAGSRNNTLCCGFGLGLRGTTNQRVTPRHAFQRRRRFFGKR